MKRFKSEYDRVYEVARRLLDPTWVKRYHGGDEDKAAECLAERYGFTGRINYVRRLCELLIDYPDREEFEQEVRNVRQAGLRLMAERLAHCEITDDPTLKKRDVPFSELAGDCYRLAYYYTLECAPDGSHLIHGHIREGSPSSPHVGHAWVELPAGIVYDGVLERFYRLKGYYAQRNARRTVAIPKDRVWMRYSQYRHFGPWDD
jgi:hypothetical protein